MDPFKTLIIGTPPSRTYTGSATGLLTSANNLSDVADGATAFTNIKQAASTSATGVIEIATQAEATAGTSSSLAITPATLNGVVSASTNTRAPAQGLVFDGTAGATHSNITLGSGDFTVAVWARVSTTSAANRQLIGSSAGDTAFFLDTTGLAKIYISGQSTYTASSVVPDQKSVLIVYTKSGSSGTFYQNAVSNGTVTDSNNYSTAWSHFGSRSGGGYTTGTLIPLIYNRALSAAEVVALYEAGTYKAISTTGLLLAPDAAQAGGGLVWYDTSGNAANITLPASGVSWNVPSSRVLGGNWTTSGNLTVSGTGNNIFNSGGGNVLIGTTTDGGQKLQVNGAATFAGAVTASGNVSISNPSSSAFSFFQAQNNNGANATIQIGTSGSARAGTYFGSAEGNLSLIFANGTSSTGLGIGTFNAKPLVLGTNNTAALTINATTQAATFAGTGSFVSQLNVDRSAGGDALQVDASALAAAGTVRQRLGRIGTSGDSISLEFTYQGADSATNTFGLAFYGKTAKFRLTNSGNVVLNNTAVATNASNGFAYVSSCAGTPTGTPTTYTGMVPIVVDSTNNKLYFYTNGAWRDAGP